MSLVSETMDALIPSVTRFWKAKHRHRSQFCRHLLPAAEHCRSRSFQRSSATKHPESSKRLART